MQKCPKCKKALFQWDVAKHESECPKNEKVEEQHTVTQEDLDLNPELGQEGVEVGEVVGLGEPVQPEDAENADTSGVEEVVIEPVVETVVEEVKEPVAKAPVAKKATTKKAAKK